MSAQRYFVSFFVFVLLVCCAVAQDTGTTDGLIYHFSCTSNADCNNNGQCTRNGTCVCDNNFVGEACQYCVPGYTGTSCSEYQGCQISVSIGKRQWRPNENNTFNIWDIELLPAIENMIFENVTIWLENAENITKMWNLEKIGDDSTNNRTLFKIITGNFSWVSLSSPAGFVLGSDDVIPRVYADNCTFAGIAPAKAYVFFSSTGVSHDNAGGIISTYSLSLSTIYTNLHYVGLSITPTEGSVIRGYAGMTYEYPYYYIENKLYQVIYVNQQGLGALIVSIETQNFTKVPESLTPRQKTNAVVVASVVGTLLFIAAISFSLLFYMTRTKWWQQKFEEKKQMPNKNVELGELRNENDAKADAGADAGAILTCTLGDPSAPDIDLTDG